MEGNYILAGQDTYASLLNNFIKQYPEFIDADNLKDFMKKTVNKFLYSYGSSLSYATKKISKNYSNKQLKVIQQTMNYPFMTESKLFLDSGGFQLSNGALLEKDIPKFIDMYYQFLEDNKDDYHKAFILDIPPGPGSVFSSYNEVYKLNRDSYEKSLNLSPDVRDKVIYIHHFRTPEIQKIWRKLLFEDGLADGYSYYSTGGLVAYGRSDIQQPAVLYSIPLVDLITYAKKKDLKKFNFHVLGGSHFRDVFYHKLFTYHIKKVHDIDIDITFDSSSVFKAVFNARTLHVPKKDGSLVKMGIKSNNLHMIWENNITIEEKLYEVLNMIAEEGGFKKLDPSEVPIYNSEETFSRHLYIYLMLYMLHFYKQMEDRFEQEVKEIYNLYEQCDIQEFDEQIMENTRLINQGRMTKKQKSKAIGVYNTLKILENLDLEYVEHFVHKYSGDDEATGNFDDELLEFSY